MATNRQEHVQTIAGLRTGIGAAKDQRDKHPENSPLWNAFDDQILLLEQCAIADSMAFTRGLAHRIVVEFNLLQKAA